jgi:hypothetical protein
VNSKNTKIEIHKKMADRLYEGLVIAQVDHKAQGDEGESSKEDVEFSNAIIVLDDSRPSYKSVREINSMWLGEPSYAPSSYVMSTIDPANESVQTNGNNKEDDARYKELSKEGSPLGEKDALNGCKGLHPVK